MNAVIKSVVREFKWPPNVIGGFFIDDLDYEGIIYWYDDLVDSIDEMDRNLENK